MQWLFNIDGQEWLAALHESPWVTRVQVLLSAGLGVTGIVSYFAGEGLRRLALPLRSKHGSR